MPPRLCDLAGWAWVKRRTLAKRRRVFLRLTGSVLAAHAAPRAPVEWDVCVVHAAVVAAPRRAALLLALPAGPALHVLLPDRPAARAWADALAAAAARSFEELYQMGPKIGEGAFASVYRVIERATGAEFAVKRIRKKQFDMQMARELEREMYAMKATRHAGVVRTHDVFNTQDRVLLVLDLMKGGTLKDNVQAAGGRVPETHAVAVVRQVLHALHYLHAQGIVHRDIKLENVLCETHIIPTTTVRVADFGYVNFVDDRAHFCLRSLVGTPVYVAPEIINRQQYGCPVDMYAVGVMLYRMLSGSYPFDAGEDDEKTMALAAKGHLSFEEPAWANTSIMCKNFVRALLQRRPECRLTAQGALCHPWVQGVTTGEQLLTSPVTPYSNPSSIKRNLADILEQEANVLGKAHGFRPANGSVEHIELQKTRVQFTSTEASRARFRWRKWVIACIFLTKLPRACGMRPLRPTRVAYRRMRRSEARHGQGGASMSMRRRIVSAFASGERRRPSSYQVGDLDEGGLDLGERIRRTISFSRG